MNLYRYERLALFILLACLIGVLVYRARDRFQQVFMADGADPGRESITVMVTGAVERPGEYRLRAGSGAREAAIAAGPTVDASLEDMPLCEPLAGGEVVYVPRVGEEAADAVRRGEAGLKKIRRPIQVRRIDINSATRDQLVTIPGIGEKTAEAIIIERSRRPFRDTSGLKKVAGIGEKRYMKIREYVTVLSGVEDDSFSLPPERRTCNHTGVGVQ